MDKNFIITQLDETRKEEHGQLVVNSFNVHYAKKGYEKYMPFSGHDATLFFDVYAHISKGYNFAAVDTETDKLIGACFYHPREYHVGLGVMAIHPDYMGLGIGKRLVEEILNFTKRNGYKSLRLVGSALNIESFSLYNRMGFIPRQVFHTMMINVVDDYSFDHSQIRKAEIKDIDEIAELEYSISGISRKNDYKFAIEDPLNIFQLLVYVSLEGQIEGFVMSSLHTASSIIGPGVGKNETIMKSLIKNNLEYYRGSSAMFLLPMENHTLVTEMYNLGAKNVETHLYQVWGDYTKPKGVVLPSFLPESG